MMQMTTMMGLFDYRERFYATIVNHFASAELNLEPLDHPDGGSVFPGITGTVSTRG